MEDKKPNAIKLKAQTVEKMKALNIEVAGVSLSSYDDKINHLIWFYTHYKNSNGHPEVR